MENFRKFNRSEQNVILNWVSQESSHHTTHKTDGSVKHWCLIAFHSLKSEGFIEERNNGKSYLTKDKGIDLFWHLKSNVA